MSDHGQVLADSPDCISLPWTQEVKTCICRPLPFSKWVFLANRPLYGLRESPLRWLIHVSACLRRRRYRKMRGDLRLFTRIENAIFRAIALLYVGDLLAGFVNPEEVHRFTTSLEEYRYGILNPGKFIGIPRHGPGIEQRVRNFVIAERFYR